jgi:hypothetical protein
MAGGDDGLYSLLVALGLEPWGPPISVLVLIALGGWIYRHRRKDLWLLLGVTAFVACSWTYHRWYDDLLILLPMVALFRVVKREPANGEGVVAGALLAATLLVMLAPGGLYLFPPPWKMLYMAGQIIVWIIGLIVLLKLTQRDKSVRMA